MDREKARAITKRFAEKFSGEVGTIEGDDGTPVTLSGISCSLFCVRARADKYGCPPGESAVLAEWLPAGMTHGEWPKDGGFPQETGVDKKRIPKKSTWVTFPRTFGGLPVYYKRGSQAFAL